MKGECVKYGPVVHISVDRESAVSILFMTDFVTFFYVALNKFCPF